MGADDVKRSMRVPGALGGTPLMDFNATEGGQLRQQSVAAVETLAVPGAITPPFSQVSLPVEGGIRDQAGPAGSVPARGGAKLGPPVRSAPGGDVFPKGSGTVADPGLPSARDRTLPAVEIREARADRIVVPGYTERVMPGMTGASGLQPGESSGLLPRQGE